MEYPKDSRGLGLQVIEEVGVIISTKFPNF